MVARESSAIIPWTRPVGSPWHPKSRYARQIAKRRPHGSVSVTTGINASVGAVAVGATCGTAVVGGTDLAEAVLARADAAMYADKRFRYVIFRNFKWQSAIRMATRSALAVASHS